MRRIIALALVAVYLSLGMVSSAKVDDDDNWSSVHDRVFNANESIEPSSTLNSLKELDEIFSKKPVAFFARRKKVMILIEASKILPGKCYYKRPVVNFLNLIKEYKTINALNVVKYLEYFKDQQLAVCEQLLAKYLKEEVARLNENERNSIESLRANIVEANNGIDFEDPLMDIPREAVEEGARNFLQQQVPEEEQDEMAKNVMFGYALDRLIVQLCGWTKRGVDPMLEIIDLMAGNKQRTTVLVDRFSVKWITNVRMCQQIAG